MKVNNSNNKQHNKIRRHKLFGIGFVRIHMEIKATTEFLKPNKNNVMFIYKI